ncbi:MAG: BREX system Lon protease-like protein BrxL, partial [Promethearchaeota archaeon]
MAAHQRDFMAHQEEAIKRYNDKIKTIFRETCINKALVHDQRARELPRYIFEWLISKHQTDGQLTPENKRDMYRLIEEHYPDPENIELYKHQILMENETLHILNPYKVSIDARSEKYVIYFPFFSSETRNIDIVESIVNQNKGLLTSGLWGIASITKGAPHKPPFFINAFSPVQIEEVHLDQFIAARAQFNIVEWVELLINTIGLNPTSFPTVNEKMLLLTRLLPYVEPNYNLIEMGPKGTGKSFIHKNTSTHSHVIGGGTISRAQLFYNLGKESRGILLTNDVVVFDDFSNLRIEQANEVIGKLKNFMNDGIIDVGRIRETCGASVMIMGNVELDQDGFPANNFFFRNLPREMQESAFLDRIAGFIPGWQLHPIRKRDLSMNYGLIGDWFSELLHA